MINTSLNQKNTKTNLKPGNDRRQPFLVMDNVYKSYPNGYKALENVNLNIAEGEFITIIGHSGCGKSTLLNMVSGFSYPSQGSVTINGQKITKPGPDRMVVFQGYALLPWRTVFENVYIAVNAVFMLCYLGGRCLKMFISLLMRYFLISQKLRKMPLLKSI